MSWKTGVWYKTTDDFMTEFRHNSCANKEIGDLLIEVFGGVDEIKFRVELDGDDVVDIISENQLINDKIAEKFPSLCVSYWFDGDESEFFFTDEDIMQDKIKKAFPFEVNGVQVDNVSEMLEVLEDILSERKGKEIHALDNSIAEIEAELIKLKRKREILAAG